ncbi:MAG: cob(I)yrinic acid a,c-diamide adenosyltransferase [Rhodothermia bacterium]
MKIYTKTGDSGTTGLFGGDRVSKHHIRIEAYGTVDELNAAVGLLRSGLIIAALPSPDRFTEIDTALARIQNELFVLGADLATPSGAKPSVPRVSSLMTTTLELEIDRFSERLPELTSFVLPGGSEAASRLHVARTVCRRAERLVVHASAKESLNPEIVRYLNRLSDHLFVLARLANHLEDVKAPEWHPIEPS